MMRNLTAGALVSSFLFVGTPAFASPSNSPCHVYRVTFDSQTDRLYELDGRITILKARLRQITEDALYNGKELDQAEFVRIGKLILDTNKKLQSVTLQRQRTFKALMECKLKHEV